MQIQFDNFSPQAFERMIQSLCIRVLGPGIVVFGAGPDGGREATFDGVVPYPSAVDRWDGYIVVQAKCREDLRHDKSDADWFVQQMRDEFAAFQKRARTLRKPQYYIACTNVALSAEPENGGKAKVERVFVKFAQEFGLKGWGVWSADELRAHLEGATDVRTAYSPWLMPGDVLMRMLDSLERPNLKQLLPLALVRDLREERDLRLRDAGQETDEKIFLENVFVDLPVGDVPLAPPRPGRQETGPSNIVARLLQRAADRLNVADSGERPSARHAALRNRLVILGGPGQGKSTVGQFLAQLARARLLRADERFAANPQTADIIAPILDRAAAEGLSLLGPVRFPIRIDIPRFADALEKARASDASLTLIGYMATRLARGIDAAVTANDVRTWLGTCPSVLVLDGLDEVPPSGNRTDVIAAIDALWDDLHLVRADTLVIVTTRPQGYDHDLDPAYWEHWSLSPFSADDATAFATRLAEVRLSDQDRRDEIVAELRAASDDPTTKSLMISPLQVTIMFGIALLKGVIPRDRWDLFNQYYERLRDREMLKPAPSAAIVRDYKRQIDALHQEAGFLLQVESETAGGATAFLTRTRFEALAQRLLREEQYDEPSVMRISGELVRIATDRLVLLAARVQGRIAFDVRSLQEYMAAAQLTSATNASIVERLRAIALSAHWRHVFRIAASRIFSMVEFGHFRADVLAICHAADAGDLDEDGRTTRSGARLAHELAGDRIAFTAPKFRKQLVRRALAMLDLGSASAHELHHQFAPETADVFREELTERIRQGTTQAAYAAWNLTFDLLGVDRDFAAGIFQRYWHSLDPSVAMDILFVLRTKIRSSAAAPYVVDAQRRAGIAGAMHLLDGAGDAVEREEWSLVPGALRRGDVSTLAVGSKQLPLLFTDLVSISAPRQAADGAGVPEDDARVHPSWTAVRCIMRFAEEPSIAALAAALRSMAGTDTDYTAVLASVPWILQTLWREHRDGSALADLVGAVEMGRFGGVDDWRKAEARWAKLGIQPRDIATWHGDHYVSDRIARAGAPYLINLRGASGIKSHVAALAQLVDTLIAVGLPRANALAFAILSELSEERSSYVADGEITRLVVGLLRAAGETEVATQLMRRTLMLDFSYWHAPTYLDFADRFGRRGMLGVENVPRTTSIIAYRYNDGTHRRGLLSILGEAIQYGGGADEALSFIHESAFRVQDDDEAAVRRGVALLRLATRKWTADEGEELAFTLTSDPSMISGKVLRDVFHDRAVDGHPGALALLRMLVARVVEIRPDQQWPLVDLLSARCGARLSSLVREDERARLDLPSPPS